MTDSQRLHAITVLGKDRPGIIADAAERLSGLGLNLEDSTMTLLRGHFSMMLLSAGTASTSEIESGLAPLATGGSLTVTVREVPADDDTAVVSGTPWILSVHGGDRPGIVAALLAEVARVGGNITDLTTRLAGALYVVIAEIDLPAGADAAAVTAAIEAVAADLGVDATLRPAEADDL